MNNNRDLRKIKERITITHIHNEKEWSALLADNSLLTLFNSWSWGEYKSNLGWKAVRVIIKVDGSIDNTGALLMQIKEYGPVRIYLIQGGIRFSMCNEEILTAATEVLLTEHFHLRCRDVVIINYYDGIKDEHSRSLLSLGFNPVINNKMYTFHVDFTNSLVADESMLHKNWRHNLRRSKKNPNLTMRWCQSTKERTRAFNSLIRMYEELKARKAFRSSINAERIKDIVIKDKRFLIAIAELDNKLAAVRIGYHSTDTVTDFLTASNELAIKTYANYLLLWSLVKKSESLGVKRFDCGGIDPLDNKGVYYFKRGLTGQLKLNGPYWIYNKSKFLRRFISILFYSRTS
mgnify:CR=1 FL=1